MNDTPFEKYPITDLNPTEREIIKFVYRWKKNYLPNSRDIAENLRLPQSTVSSTLKRMKDSKKKKNIFEWEPHHGVELTEEGQIIAEHIENHHHIMEIFLHKALELDEHQAHKESESLGISVSCDLTKIISNYYKLTLESLGESCICPDDKEQECVFK